MLGRVVHPRRYHEANECTCGKDQTQCNRPYTAVRMRGSRRPDERGAAVVLPDGSGSYSDSQSMGQIGRRRVDRDRWHILVDATPVCERVQGGEIGRTSFYLRVKDDLICGHCHHEFSWREMLHDVEWQAASYHLSPAGARRGVVLADR